MSEAADRAKPNRSNGCVIVELRPKLSLRAGVAALCGGVLAIGAPAAAASPPVRIAAPTRGALSCQLSVNSRTVANVSTLAAARVTARVTVLHSGHGFGTYRLALACPPAPPVTRLVHVARQPNALWGGPLRVRVSFRRSAPSGSPGSGGAAPLPPGSPAPLLPAVRSPRLTAAARAFAQSLWVTRWASYYDAAFSTGQCTDLVNRLRPDIVPRVMQTVIAEWKMSGASGTIQPIDWSATKWDGNAAMAGMAVGATPGSGAVIVFHSHNFPADPGHVAYVDAVYPDGSLLITEEHAPVLGQVTQRVVPAREIAGQDVDFIY